jgi:hypothetical protein
MTRGILIAALALLLFVAGCGDDDDGGGDGGEREDTTTEETTPTEPGMGRIAEPAGIPPARELPLGRAAARAGCELENPPIQGQEHVETQVDYDSNPPTSGPHFPVPAEDGVYTKAPPKEGLVHSLEHGRIVIQFQRDLDEAAKGGLQSLFDEDSQHVILTPNTTDMPYEVAATAWGHLVGCPRMNDRVYDALRAFTARYRDKGPEDVP